MALKQKIAQLDPISNLLFIPALTALFLAFSWAGTKYSRGSGPVTGPFVAFAVLMAGFIYNQRCRGDNVALPLRIVKRRSSVAGFILLRAVTVLVACSSIIYLLTIKMYVDTLPLKVAT